MDVVVASVMGLSRETSLVRERAELVKRTPGSHQNLQAMHLSLSLSFPCCLFEHRTEVLEGCLSGAMPEPVTPASPQSVKRTLNAEQGTLRQPKTKNRAHCQNPNIKRPFHPILRGLHLIVLSHGRKRELRLGFCPLGFTHMDRPDPV